MQIVHVHLLGHFKRSKLYFEGLEYFSQVDIEGLKVFG